MVATVPSHLCRRWPRLDWNQKNQLRRSFIFSKWIWSTFFSENKKPDTLRSRFFQEGSIIQKYRQTGLLAFPFSLEWWRKFCVVPLLRRSSYARVRIKKNRVCRSDLGLVLKKNCSPFLSKSGFEADWIFLETEQRNFGTSCKKTSSEFYKKVTKVVL